MSKEAREHRYRVAELRHAHAHRLKEARVSANLQRANLQFEAKASELSLSTKGLIGINGAGAIALGALVQALIGKPDVETLIPAVITGIGWLISGTACAASIYLATYVQGLIEGAYRRVLWRNPMWWLRWTLTVLSLLAFLVGMGIVVIEGLKVFSGPLRLA